MPKKIGKKEFFYTNYFFLPLEIKTPNQLMKKIFLLFLLFISINLFSQKKYVSISGNDNNNGSIEFPYKTVTKALSEISSGEIILRKGRYREVFVIDGKSNLTIRPYENEKVIFDGTIDISSFNWTNTGNNIFKTDIQTSIWQLFVNHKEMVMARWPNAQFSNKSIYNWSSWAQGDETNSNNGLLTVDPNYHDMSSINHTLDSAHAILNIGSFRTWNRKINHTKGNNNFTYDPVPNGAYKTKHHHFFIEGDLDLLDTLTNPGVWPALKRVLMNKCVRIEDLGETYGWSTGGIKPEPVPVEVKVILVGSPMHYELLLQYDEDFGRLFKVKADFSESIDSDHHTIRDYQVFIEFHRQKNDLLPFTEEAISRVLQESSRFVSDK